MYSLSNSPEIELDKCHAIHLECLGGVVRVLARRLVNRFT